MQHTAMKFVKWSIILDSRAQPWSTISTHVKRQQVSVFSTSDPPWTLKNCTEHSNGLQIQRRDTKRVWHRNGIGETE